VALFYTDLGSTPWFFDRDVEVQKSNGLPSATAIAMVLDVLIDRRVSPTDLGHPQLEYPISQLVLKLKHSLSATDR
jgi:hypothetical protein